MSTPFETLGVAPDASPAAIKAAYHAKLRQFPAHTHPEEFKTIRAAYEAIQKGVPQPNQDFLKLRPLEVSLDAAVVEQLREKALAKISVTLDELIRETF
jgi:hypothetical protein